MIHPFVLIASLPYTFLKPVFLFMFYRLYKGRTTRRRTIFVGLLSELQVAVPSYLSYIITISMYPPGWFSFPIVYPIPLVFIIGLVALKLSPPPEDQSWIQESEPSYWWKETEKHPEPEKEESDIWMDEPEIETEKDSDAHN
jgi:hypothetical protein